MSVRIRQAVVAATVIAATAGAAAPALAAPATAPAGHAAHLSALPIDGEDGAADSADEMHGPEDPASFDAE